MGSRRKPEPGAEIAALRARIAGLEGRAVELQRAAAAQERKAAEARSILEVGRAITASLDLQAVLDLVVERACVLLRTERSGLAILEGDGGEPVVRFVARRGMSFQFPDRMRPRHERDGTTPTAIAERRPVWSADILADPAFDLTPATRAAIEAEGYRAVLSVPLLAGERVVGALVVYRDAPGPFAPDEVDLLQAFAAQAVVAIQNARFYDEAERRRREAETIADLARTITASLDLDTVLQRVVEAARNLCGGDMAHIALRNPGSDALVFRYWAGWRSQGFQAFEVTPGKGVGGQVLVTGRPFRTDDYAADPRITKDYMATIEGEKIVASMAVPIRIGVRVEGLLFVDNRDPRPFTDRDEAILMRLADHAAIGIRNARLLAESEARRRAAESLADLGRLVSQSLNLVEVAQRIADSAHVLLGAAASTLYRLAESGDLVELASAGELGPGLRSPLVLPRGTGVSGLAVRERRPVVTANALRDPRVQLTPEWRAGAESAPFRAVLGLPLTVQDRVIGALAVADREGRVFDAEDLRLAQTLADQAALALDNARLYEEAQRRLAELATVQRVARAINSTLRLEEVFQAVVHQISTAFGYRMVSIHLVTGDGLALQACVGYQQVIPLIPFDKGMTGRVARTGRAEFVRDATQDQDFLFAVPDVRQGIIVPLKGSDGRVLGTVGIESTGEPALSEADLTLLTLLADQISVAVANARFYAQATRRQAEAEELARTARTLAESLDTAEVGERILQSVVRLFNVHTATLRLLQPDGSLIAVGLGGPARQHYPTGHVLPARMGLPGRAVAEGRPVWVRDVRNEPDLTLTDDLRGRILATGNRASLAVPLSAKGKIVGTLTIGYAVVRDFSEGEVALLQALADQAAIALENSRLYGELQAALREVEASQQRVIQGERLRALGELAGGVAHDFNNTLAAIMGRAQLLLDRMEDPAIRRQLQVIEQAAMDGARTVRRIQEFTRMRRARPFQAVDLNQVVEEVVEVTRSRWRDEAQAQGLTFDVRVEASPVPPVAGDPSELREALTNLVLNALDAMPRGGRVGIRTAVDGSHVVCVVSDTGVGMSDEVRRRVFDPFFTTKAEKGTGLGLSLVYGIITRHGGEIDVRSQPGQGSAFTIRLPVGREIPEVQVSAAPARARPARILVIDDEEWVRETLVELLKRDGHTVVACADGLAGITRFQEEAFEVVFTDLGMPKLSGWEVARLVKLRRPATPVVLVTGWGDQIDPLEAQAQGVEFLIPKPFQSEEVSAVVARALAAGRGAPAI
jgi:GAF domain-containing protein/ActR/RegA family two-component response regulator